MKINPKRAQSSDQQNCFVLVYVEKARRLFEKSSIVIKIATEKIALHIT